jgi:hypothetical protein
VEETVEGARNAEGGTSRRGLGTPSVVDSGCDVAKRTETPRKAPGVHTGQVTTESSLKESEADERMIPSL